MSFVATAIVGSSVIGAVSAKKAAKAQRKAAKRGIDTQQAQYDQTREDFAPWREAGGRALDRLDRASSGDASDFYTSPGYEFVRGEGTRDIGNSFAARGGSMSGNAMRALTEYNQNVASNEYGNWWARQAGIAGVGQSATQSTAVAGRNAANNISQGYTNAGNARASGIAGVNDALQSGIGNWMYYRGRQKPPQSPYATPPIYGGR